MAGHIKGFSANGSESIDYTTRQRALELALGQSFSGDAEDVVREAEIFAQYLFDGTVPKDEEPE